MDDLLRVLIFAGIFFFLSALGSGKRKKPPQQRPQPGPRRPELSGRALEPAQRRRPERAATSAPPAAEPESLTGALFAILRGEVPAPPQAQERGEVFLDGPEAVSLETLEPAGEASHQRFHDEYVAHPATFEVERTRRARRLRVTAKTAREAIVWTAILSKPKGLQ